MRAVLCNCFQGGWAVLDMWETLFWLKRPQGVLPLLPPLASLFLLGSVGSSPHLPAPLLALIPFSAEASGCHQS